MKDPFDRLSAAWVITKDGRFVPGVGGYPIGSIAAFFWTRRQGESELPGIEAAMELPPGSLALMRIDDPWKGMRRAAAEGLCAFEPLHSEEESTRFIFMTRVEEAGSELPTVLVCQHEGEWGPSLCRNGRRDLSHAALLHWQRFDVLDRVTATWGKRSPFRDWSNGQPFFELRGSSVDVVLVSEIGICGHWGDEFCVFFTDRESAKHWLECPDCGLASRRSRFVSRGPAEPTREVQVVEVSDLRARLLALGAMLPIASYAFNPNGHRETAAWGSFCAGRTAEDDQDPWSV